MTPDEQASADASEIERNFVKCDECGLVHDRRQSCARVQAAELLVEFVQDKLDDGNRSDEWWTQFDAELREHIAALAQPKVGDGEILDELHVVLWEAAKTAKPLRGYPVPKEQLGAFRYGKDCAAADIEKAVCDLLERLTSP